MRTIAALRFVPLIAAAALAACGGGGGGDGGGGGGGATNPPAFAFNDGNALTASALALRVIEAPGVIAELPLLATLELDRRRVAQFDLPCGSTSITLRHTDADGNGSISPGDSVSADQPARCSGIASGRITMRLSTVDVRNLHIEGTAEFDLVTPAGDRMVGTLSLATSVDSKIGVLVFSLTNLALTSTRDGTTERLSSARFDRRFHPLADNYDFDFAGQLDSDLLGGRYSFSTPVRFTGVFGLLPEGGELVSVAGPTRVRIAVSSVPAQRQSMADYQLDTGSGYGPTTSVRWRELTGGPLFYWVPNDPPVISSLEVLPANPRTGSVVTAHVAATDPDRDPLTYEFTWTVGQQTSTGNDPTFPLLGLKKGATVSVTVRVSDGRAQVASSTSFTVGNSPPVITSLTIDPPAPRSIDELHVTPAFEDLDADALAVRYEWQKNGASIPGAAAATLPRSAYARADVVTAIVYVTDGSDTVSRQESVTIGDSLPQLTWLSPPGALAHGAPFGARAVATDPDGDALPPGLRFALRYGPTGMTLDSTTGAVSWLAGGPMFDRSMKVRYGVGTNIEGAGLIAGEVTIEDSDREYPLARSSLLPGVYRSGLRAGDFDGDGDAEMLMLTAYGVLYEVEAVGNTYRQAWMYPFSLNPLPRAFATANVDGHPAHEIFVATGNVLLRLDGVARRVTASATLPVDNSLAACADLQTADLDRDGTVELVCSMAPNGSPETGGSHPIVVFDAATLAVERQIAGGAVGNELAVGNVDTDPALEIVTWRGFVFDGVTFTQEWASSQPFGQGIAVGDVTGDGIAEIVGGEGNESGTFGRVFSALTRSKLVDLPHPSFTMTTIANIDGTGRAEILMGGHQFAAYRYEPSGSVTTVFTTPLPNDGYAAALAVANVDRSQDTLLEFVISTADGIVIADRPTSGLRIEWNSANLGPAIPQTMWGPFFGGELARSPSIAPEPLFMSQQAGFTGSRLFSLDPVSGDLTFAPEIPQGLSYFEPGDLVVTDFDRDGTDDAFISIADAYAPAVGAYDFFAGQMAFRSAALQPGYAALDVDHGDFNGDGRDDLVALTQDGSLLVYDAFASSLLWSEQTGLDGHAVVVADLDSSGPPEIIVATTRQVLVFSRATPSAPFVRRYESDYYAFTGDMTAGDVDGDGRVDIFLVYSGPGPWVQRFNERLEPVTSLNLGTWSPASLSIESSPFGRRNLVATYWEPAGSQLRVIDPVLGDEIWRSPPIHGRFAPNSVHFVDMAGNGTFRIAFGTYDGVFLTR